jgi:hypothetical protein
MKHIDLFNGFLKNTVNLNETRVTGLENSIRFGLGAAYQWLDGAWLMGAQDDHPPGG